MHFNLEADFGDRIIGYVVPDGFSTVPVIRLEIDGEVLLRFEANEIREAILLAGRHATGQCGFSIGLDMVPDLPQRLNLSLFDEETGILIYRRRQTHHMVRKIFRLETHLLPLWRIDEIFRNNFQYFDRGIEAFGRETVTQMFVLNTVESLYLSGRILYKNFSFYISNGYEVICLIQDPHEEFLERLLVLSKLKESGATFLGDRDGERYKDAIDFASKLDFADMRGFMRKLTSMPRDVCDILANPLVRQLTTSTPDEMPPHSGVASALDTLSTFAIVGLRSDLPHFCGALGSLLNVDPRSIPVPQQIPRAVELAQELRAKKVVDHLIGKDLELYSVVSGAYRKAFDAN